MVIRWCNISCKVRSLKFEISFKAKSKDCLFFFHLQVRSNFHFRTGFYLRLYFVNAEQHGWLVKYAIKMIVALFSFAEEKRSIILSW